MDGWLNAWNSSSYKHNWKFCVRTKLLRRISYLCQCLWGKISVQINFHLPSQPCVVRFLKISNLIRSLHKTRSVSFIGKQPTYAKLRCVGNNLLVLISSPVGFSFCFTFFWVLTEFKCTPSKSMLKEQNINININGKRNNNGKSGLWSSASDLLILYHFFHLWT